MDILANTAHFRIFPLKNSTKTIKVLLYYEKLIGVKAGVSVK
jgi:hypothetical protein